MNEIESKKRPWFRRSVYEGILMAVLAYGGAMMIGSSVKKVIWYLMLTAVILAILDYICFHWIKESKKGLKIGIGAGAIVVNLVILLSVTIYCLAPSLLFYPNESLEDYETLQTYNNTEEITLETSQGKLSGWMLHNAEEKAPLILYFCGNGENASRRMNYIIENQQECIFEGYNLAIFNYPGYGKSEGADSESTIKKMGLFAYDGMAVRDDVDAEKIYLFGYSLGTGVANYVASERTVEGLLLMAPYSSGYDIYNNVIPIFYGPLKLLVEFQMKAEEFAKKITITPTILASTIDEAVPYESSVHLSEQYPEGCDLQTLTNIGHNDFWYTQEVIDRITEYYREELEQ